MSSSVINCHFEDYGYSCCNLKKRPSLTSKRSKLIQAVVQSQMALLMDLLDSPELYDTQDVKGFDLLQIAIASDNQEAFDYLMTLKNYPIEHKNKYGLTALGIALNYCVRGEIQLKQHYAYKLIKNGANIDIECESGNTPLHCAFERNYIRVATILIKKGVDLSSKNDVGETPLEVALQSIDRLSIRNEMFAMLVVNGAEINSRIFLHVLKTEKCFPSWIQETVFFYLFDEVSETEVDLDVLLCIAKDHIFHFKTIIQYNIVVTKPRYTFLCHEVLHSMNYENFILIVRKFGDSLKLMFEHTEAFIYYSCGNDLNLEYIGILMENGLKSQYVEIFGMLHSSYTFNIFIDRYNYDLYEQLYCFFLSYNLSISEKDMHIVYRNYGYCSLFKILLYMKILMVPHLNFARDPMASFIFDVEMDLDRFFLTSHIFESGGIFEMPQHFAHLRIKLLCANLQGDTLKSANDAPSLLELARNEFRKQLVKVFNIKTSCRFYTLLNHLPIPSAYKKIISFENKLY